MSAVKRTSKKRLTVGDMHVLGLLATSAAQRVRRTHSYSKPPWTVPMWGSTRRPRTPGSTSQVSADHICDACPLPSTIRAPRIREGALGARKALRGTHIGESTAMLAALLTIIPNPAPPMSPAIDRAPASTALLTSNAHRPTKNKAISSPFASSLQIRRPPLSAALHHTSLGLPDTILHLAQRRQPFAPG
ncbi:hypothetical protein B0H10DRAFT_2235013 [Mycena sp. CBHHK59/15]|nr:hypothetical protein B0H10DRAFT_2235013 [Mycena sp. CBHHK59/15]